MNHAKNTAVFGQEVRIVPKRGPVRYEWHVTTMCGKLVPDMLATIPSSKTLPFIGCPACLDALTPGYAKLSR